MTTLGANDGNILSGIVYALHHPDGQITVRADGHAFMSEDEARAWQRLGETGKCQDCDLVNKPHTVVYRNVYNWRSV